MKEHAKNAIKHDINVLGKSVPVVAIAALFLIGSGSAALLTNFGTVSGDAQVDQAVTIDSNDYDTEADFGFSSESITGGDSAISGENTVSNSAGELVSVDFSTEVIGPAVDGEDNTAEGADIHQLVIRQEDGSNSGDSPDGTNDVDAEVVTDEVSESDYALHFTSDVDETADYASVTYRVDGVSVSDISDGSDDAELSIDAKLGSDGENAPDEIFLTLSDGTLLFYNFGQTGTDEWQTYTASESGWTVLNADGSFGGTGSLDSYSGSIKAVSLGVGSPSEDTGVRRVDAYLDNLQVDGNAVSEVATTDFQTQLRAGESVDVVTVSGFDIRAYPGTYDFTTTVSPVTQ